MTVFPVPLFRMDDILADNMASVRGNPETFVLLGTPGLRDAVVLRLNLAWAVVMERAERFTLERYEMTLRESWILRAAHSGEYSQLTLADLLGINPNVMVLIIDRLERRGMVRRARNPKNRREQFVVLTDRGSKMLARMRKATDFEVIFEPLNKRQRAELAALCDAILNTVGDGKRKRKSS